MFGLIVIFKPGSPVYAFTIESAALDGLGQYGKNCTFFAIGYEGMRQVTKNEIAAIPDAKVRAVVSTTGSISAMVGGIACGLGTALCAGMGWEQKAVVCAQGVGICAGVATGMNEGDPMNPATVPGRLAGEATAQLSPA